MWILTSTLQKNDDRMIDHLDAGGSQFQEEDMTHWALMPVVEDAIPLACVPRNSEDYLLTRWWKERTGKEKCLI